MRASHLADTISCAYGEWMEDVPPVGGEARVIEPAFREEGIWIFEVGGGAISGILIN